MILGFAFETYTEPLGYVNSLTVGFRLSGIPLLMPPARQENRGRKLWLEEEFDRDRDMSGDWLSVPRGRFVLVLLECCYGGAL